MNPTTKSDVNAHAHGNAMVVPGKREDLHLFFYGDLLITLTFSIKDAKGGFAESANGGDLRSLNPFSEANRNSDFFTSSFLSNTSTHVFRPFSS